MSAFPVRFDSSIPSVLFRLGLALACIQSDSISGTLGLGEWETLAPMLSERQEVGVGELKGEIYVVGGFNSNDESTNVVERYNPLSNSWASIPALPATSELNHVGVASASGRLYVVGGLRQSFQAVPWVFSFEPNSNLWREEKPLPRARGACGVAVIGDVIYVAGGQDVFLTFRDFASFDPKTGEWTSLPDMPTARNHLAAAAVGERFYAISGRNGSGLQAANEVYSTTTGMWSSAAPIRTPRGGIAGASLSGRVYIIGGEGNNADPQGVFEEVEEYDPTTNSWRALEPMPLPRHGTGAAVLGDRIFVPGGGPIQGFSQTDHHDAFRPPRMLLNLWKLR